MNSFFYKFVLVIFYFSIVQSFIFGQVHNQKLVISFEENKNGRNYIFLSLAKEPNLSIVKNIPSITDKYVIYKVKISFFQENYFKFKNEKVSKEKITTYIENIGLDSVNIDNIQIPQDYFFVYVGIDLKNQKKYVTIDTNIDNNFENDSLYTFNLDDYSNYNLQDNPLDVKTKLQFTYVLENEKKSKSIQLALFPFYSDKEEKHYTNITDFYLDIGLFANNSKDASFKIQGKTYKIIASKNLSFDLLPWHLNKKTHFDIYDNNGAYLYSRLTLGDTIIIADKKIQLESVNKNNLIITEIENYSILNSAIYIHSLHDNRQISLTDVMRDKYVFIDFWGSWCNPCIHSIPILKQFYEKIKQRKDVLVLGVALENKKDINTLKNIIRDKQIPYPNYYVCTHDLKSVNYPYTAFQITQFPTYLLFDKKSNVIYKITNSKNTEKAISLFLELIESN